MYKFCNRYNAIFLLPIFKWKDSAFLIPSAKVNNWKTRAQNLNFVVCSLLIYLYFIYGCWREFVLYGVLIRLFLVFNSWNNLPTSCFPFPTIRVSSRPSFSLISSKRSSTIEQRIIQKSDEGVFCDSNSHKTVFQKGPHFMAIKIYNKKEEKKLYILHI